MSPFKRGLKPAFVNALNTEYIKGGWWKAIADKVDQRELFIGIRDEYINVYYLGNSLLRLELKRGKLVGRTHYKYLLRPEMTPAYFDMDHAGIFGLPKGMGKVFTEDFSHPNALENIRRASSRYAGDEKKGCHDIVKSNENVIDLEVAFGGHRSSKAGSSAPRIDFAALREDSGSGRNLVFYEAKHFSNKDLRSTGTPKVVGQIGKYQKLITANQIDIISSYQTVAQNFVDLDGIPKATKAIALQATTYLTVSHHPSLVIFGFDADQRSGKHWKHHLKKLRSLLGKSPVLVKGDPKGFRRGISP